MAREPRSASPAGTSGASPGSPKPSDPQRSAAADGEAGTGHDRRPWQPASVATSRAPALVGGDLAQVLYVEANDAHFRLVEQILEHDGCEVVRARSGAEALATVAELRPDLVLMEMLLPGMDGCETARRLRAAGLPSGTPMVALTVKTGKLDQQQALAAGFTRFIAKPFGVAEFRWEVEGLLAGARSRRHAVGSRGGGKDR